MARKNPQSSIDALLSRLPQDVVAEFLQWAQFGANYTDIQSRLNELGTTHDALPRNAAGEPKLISNSAIQRWYVNRWPVGTEAQAINGLATPFAGLDAKSALHVALGTAVKLMNLTVPLMNERFLVRLADEAPESLLHNTLVLLKEIRTAAIALNELQVIKDRAELELAGGYRVVAIALNMAKDTDSEGVLKEFLDGALKQLETEV
jgi:hypothetical protein